MNALSPGGETIELTVTERRTEADGIVSICLQADGAARLPRFEAGAHLDVHVAPGVVRPYSLCSDPRDDGRYVLGVLLEPASRGGSAAIHSDVHVGERIRVSPPRNNFRLVEAAPHSILAGGGIGVTPLLAMCWRLHEIGASFELHYCTRSLARTAFRGTLSAAPFASRIHLHLDDGPAGQRLNLAGTLGAAPAGSHLYVCGPAGFMEYVTGEAQRLSWAGDALHTEHFSAKVGLDGDSFSVVASRSGLTVQVAAGQTIAAALMAVGVAIPLSCEQGVCGSCLTRVLDGVPDHRDLCLSEDEQACNDQMTLCCSRAKSPVLRLDI